MKLKNSLFIILSLFFLKTLFSVVSIPGTKVSVDEKYLIQVSKILNNTKDFSVDKIKTLLDIKNNYKELEAIRNESGVKNINDFKALLSYCNNLVILRNGIELRSQEFIATLKSGFNNTQTGLKIELPNQVDNDVVKIANKILKDLEEFKVDSGNYDIYLSQEAITKIKENLDNIKPKIDDVIKDIIKINIEYSKNFVQLESSLKQAEEQLKKLEEYKKDNPNVSETINNFSNDLEIKVKRLEELKKIFEDNGVLSKEQLDELMKLTTDFNNINRSIDGELTTQLKLSEEKQTESIRLQEELKEKLATGGSVSEEDIATDTEINQKEYDVIKTYIEKLKSRNIIDYKQLHENIVSKQKDYARRLLECEAKKENLRDVSLLKVKKAAEKKIKEAKDGNTELSDTLELKKRDINNLIELLSENREKINNLERVKEKDFTKMFAKGQNEELNNAQILNENAQELEQALNTNIEEIKKLLDPIIELSKKTENLIVDSEKAVDVAILEDSDKEYLKNELEKIIRENYYIACLPYEFKLGRDISYGVIPQDWYIDVGKPDPEIEVSLQIKKSNIIEKISQIKFENSKKDIYSKLLSEKLNKQVSKYILDKDLNYVYQNLIVSNPYAKKQERKGEKSSIQSIIMDVFKPYLKTQDFGLFFNAKILDFAVILTHIKSTQIDNNKELASDNERSMRVLKTFYKILKNKGASVGMFRFYINGLRIDPAFGLGDFEFFKLLQTKEKFIFDLTKQSGAVKPISQVPLPFVLGCYSDYESGDFTNLKKQNEISLIEDNVKQNYKKSIDSFFEAIQQILVDSFAAEKIKALDNLSKIFILKDIDSFKVLQQQLKNLETIYSLNVAENDTDRITKKTKLESFAVDVKYIAVQLENLIRKKVEESKKIEDYLKLNTYLKYLKVRLKNLNNFIIGENTDENILNTVTKNISDDLNAQMKNKYGELSDRQESFLEKVDSLKNSFNQDFNLGTLANTLNNQTKKEKVIEYFTKGAGTRNLNNQIDKIKDVFLNKISLMPELFIDNLYDNTYLNTDSAKKFVPRIFGKYTEALIPLEALYTDLFSKIKNNKTLMDKFKYDVQYSYLESVGILLTQMNYAIDAKNLNKFFDVSEYKEIIGKSLQQEASLLGVNVSKKLSDDLSFIESRVGKEIYFGGYKKIFNQNFPNPKYYLALSKESFSSRDFENFVKSLFTYFYIANGMYLNGDYRLFDWSSGLETTGVQEITTTGIPPAPIGVPAASQMGQLPPPPALRLMPQAPMVVTKKDIERLSKKDFELKIFDDLFKTYDFSKPENLKKYFVEDFYCTIFNFLNLVINSDLNFVINDLENIASGKVIEGVLPEVKSGDFAIYNQQSTSFKLLSAQETLKDLVKDIKTIKLDLKIEKNNNISVSYNLEKELKTDAIMDKLRQDLEDKYTKGFVIEETVENSFESKKVNGIEKIKTAIDDNLIKFIQERFDLYLRILNQYKNFELNLTQWNMWNLEIKKL